MEFPANESRICEFWILLSCNGGSNEHFVNTANRVLGYFWLKKAPKSDWKRYEPFSKRATFGVTSFDVKKNLPGFREVLLSYYVFFKKKLLKKKF